MKNNTVNQVSLFWILRMVAIISIIQIMIAVASFIFDVNNIILGGELVILMVSSLLKPLKRTIPVAELYWLVAYQLN